MRKSIFAAAALVLLTGCSPTAEEQANQPVAEAPREKPPHCFFKDSETRGWAVKVAGGQAVVTGQAFRSDARYKAVLTEPKVVGRVAAIYPTITVNDTGFAAEGNWWDLKSEIPATEIDTIEVRCGSKLVATLAVKG